jgi:drug/metabolite transporter (DMT)-like permease
MTGRRRADTLLLVTAAIWGFAFVAQRRGMEFVGPFTFNALRFALGGGLVLAGTWFGARRARGRVEADRAPGQRGARRRLLEGSLAVGVVLFAGASLQQGGLVTTDAGKAGFITGLYVVLVPLFGLAVGRRTPRATWLGAALATAGLYLLTVQAGLGIVRGDLLVLAGAACWAVHVLVVAHYAPRVEPARLAAGQFLVCASISAVAALALEAGHGGDVAGAAVPILYAGVVSVGIAYTLQVYGQRHAPPGHAAIVMSLEAVFAAIGGWLLLSERLSAHELAGAALMFAGMIVSGIAARPAPP